MKKSRTPVIRGPIGMGAPFKMQYNSDGTPNYVRSVTQQRQAGGLSKAVEHNHSHIQDKGRQYESKSIQQLHSRIAEIQKHFSQQQAAQKQSPNTPSPSISKHHQIQSINKQVNNNPKPTIKHAPAIKR